MALPCQHSFSHRVPVHLFLSASEAGLCSVPRQREEWPEFLSIRKPLRYWTKQIPAPLSRLVRLAAQERKVRVHPLLQRDTACVPQETFHAMDRRPETFQRTPPAAVRQARARNSA